MKSPVTLKHEVPPRHSPLPSQKASAVPRSFVPIRLKLNPAKAGLSQAEVARRMGTKVPAISRLESGGGIKKHSPSIGTLRRYAKAVGCHLEVRLKPGKQKKAA